MKICPKCRYLDHEETGSSYECPKCGVIYSRVLESINQEKIRKNVESYTIVKKKNGWSIDTVPTFWVWAGIAAIVAVISGINIQRTLGNENYFPSVPTSPQKTSERFVTKYEMRTSEALNSEFEVVSNDAPNTIFILLDKTSKQKKALVYVKRNEKIALKVPEGEYAYQMIEGQEWINDQEHFGRSTVYKDGETTLDFSPKKKCTVTLKTIEGNMHPRKTGRIELN